MRTMNRKKGENTRAGRFFFPCLRDRFGAQGEGERISHVQGEATRPSTMTKCGIAGNGHRFEAAEFA